MLEHAQWVSSECILSILRLVLVLFFYVFYKVYTKLRHRGKVCRFVKRNA